MKTRSPGPFERCPEMFDDLENIVALYKNEYRKKYRAFTREISKVMDRVTHAIVPHAIVQWRVKTVSSFADKVLRKRYKYEFPLEEMTDLGGVRVVVHTRSEVEKLCEFVKKHFDIDKRNSFDAANRLDPSTFGYRSVHYVIQGIKPELRDWKLKHEDIEGLKAELQIRTIAEHCWADIGHDRVFKSGFDVPDQWKRQFSLTSALLEDVDEAFSRAIQGLKVYQTGDGRFLNRRRLEEELSRLQKIAPHVTEDPEKIALACRHARLLMAIARWDDVERLVMKYAKKAKISLLQLPSQLSLLMATAQWQKGDVAKAIDLLKKVQETDPEYVETLVTLAEIYRQLEPAGRAGNKVLEYYTQAYKIDSSEVRALTGVAVEKAFIDRNMGFVSLIRPNLEAAIQRSGNQVAVGVNLPWAQFHIGEAHLLLSNPHEALYAYTKAFLYVSDAFMLEMASRRIARLTDLAPTDNDEEARRCKQGASWVELLIQVCRASRSTAYPASSRQTPHPRPASDSSNTKRIEVQKDPPLNFAGNRKVVLIPSDVVFPLADRNNSWEESSENIRERLARYKPGIEKTFEYFDGVVFCQIPSTWPITTYIKELVSKEGSKIDAVTYWRHEDRGVQEPLKGFTARLIDDGRAREFNSPVTALCTWQELFDKGIDPSRVKVLGIDGGFVAGFSYRLALILGAQVGLVRGSGGEADKLLDDPDWAQHENLTELPFEGYETWGDFLHGKIHTVRCLAEDTSNKEALAKLANDYSRDSNCVVKYEGEELDYLDKITDEMMLESKGIHDIVLNYSYRLSRYVRNKLVYTVGELKDLVPDADFSFEEHLRVKTIHKLWLDSSYCVVGENKQPEAIGYPFAFNTMILVYNRTMVEEPPLTWDDLVEVAARCKGPDRYGIVLQGKGDGEGDWRYYEWCNLVYGLGGGIIEKDYGTQNRGELKLNSKETKAATEMYRRLLYESSPEQDYYWSTGHKEQQTIMKEGRGAMAIMWSDRLMKFLYEISASGKQSSFGFAPIPGGRSMNGSGTFFVYRQPKGDIKRARRAARYVVAMMDEQTQRKLMKEGLCSIYSHLYTDEELQHQIPYLGAVHASMKKAGFMLEASRFAPDIRKLVQRAIKDIMSDRSISVGDVLDQAVNRSRSLIGSGMSVT